ncbi:metaxin-1-like [Xenopus laevis]|uniref:Metaxin-1-like n=1 Tax=Xenopus laevis TaxID=8355 RepID=A0A8J1LJM1_XENLA|nr:metaxin-1-like [Xenopus laevis]
MCLPDKGRIHWASSPACAGESDLWGCYYFYTHSITSLLGTLAWGSYHVLPPAHRPQIGSFSVERKNKVAHTRKWHTESPNFFLPNQMHKRNMERLKLIRGESWREEDEEMEGRLYTDAHEWVPLLSQSLDKNNNFFFFWECSASLDVHVFSHLAPILNAKLPNNKLHLSSLPNLYLFCSSIITVYFPWALAPGSKSAPGRNHLHSTCSANIGAISLVAVTWGSINPLTHQLNPMQL